MNRGGDRLVEVLERLAVRPMPQSHVPQFKASQNNGQKDIEYFINYLEEITKPNKWRHPAALLHFGNHLKKVLKVVGEQKIYQQSILLLELDLEFHYRKPDPG